MLYITHPHCHTCEGTGPCNVAVAVGIEDIWVLETTSNLWEAVTSRVTATVSKVLKVWEVGVRREGGNGYRKEANEVKSLPTQQS